MSKRFSKVILHLKIYIPLTLEKTDECFLLMEERDSKQFKQEAFTDSPTVYDDV